MDNKKELGEKKTITYKGKSVTTSVWRYVSEEERQKICTIYYKKPDFDEVKLNFVQIQRGGTNSSKISRYYVRDLMDKTILYCDRWCVEDIFSSCDLLGCFMAKVERNTDLFDTNQSMIVNLEKALQLGGAGFAHIPTNFPIKTVDQVLSRFNVNNNWYDMSCGWGVRQMCAMRMGLNYYGTDPNYELVEKLNEFNKTYKQVNHTTKETKIYCQGSEHFIPQLENKIGLAFSSPPYFDLEDYGIGDQSYKPGTTFDQWVTRYLEPTFANIYKYLITNDYFIVNIKDFNGIKLEETTIKTAEKVGFRLYKVEQLNQGKRLNSTSEEKGDLIVDSSENIYIFVKTGFVKQSRGFDLFDFDDDTEEQKEPQAIKVGTTTKVNRETKEIVKENEIKVVSLW